MLCEAQKSIIINFMNQHEELRKGQFTASFSYKKAQQLWEEVTVKLNSVPNGQFKDWKKWRKTWQDMKKNAKAKNAQINRHRNTTGGGPVCSKTLSHTETEVLDLLSPIQMDRIGIEETPINFSFSDDVDGDSPENESNTAAEVAERAREEVLELPKIDQDAAKVTYNKPAEQNNEEHNYNLQYPVSKKVKPPKKISKTARLQTSLALSQKHLASINERNNVEVSYYRGKMYNETRKMRAQLRMERQKNSWWRNLKN